MPINLQPGESVEVKRMTMAELVAKANEAKTANTAVAKKIKVIGRADITETENGDKLLVIAFPLRGIGADSHVEWKETTYRRKDGSYSARYQGQTTLEYVVPDGVLPLVGPNGAITFHKIIPSAGSQSGNRRFLTFGLELEPTADNE
jgi:hypothetical protein